MGIFKSKDSLKAENDKLQKQLEQERTARFEAEQKAYALETSIIYFNAWIKSLDAQDTVCMVNFNKTHPLLREAAEKFLIVNEFHLISIPEHGWWRKQPKYNTDPSAFQDVIMRSCYDEIIEKHSLLVGKTLWEIDSDNFDAPQVVECIITNTIKDPDSNEVYIAFHAKDDESRDNVLPLSEYEKKFFFNRIPAEESLGIYRIGYN